MSRRSLLQPAIQRTASRRTRRADFRRPGLGCILAVWVVVAPVGYAQGQSVLYVDANGVGGSGSGTSWADAFVDLPDALQAATNNPTVTEIWVAAGTYHPDRINGVASGSRFDSFELRNNLALYGGFSGVETQREQRDWRANVAILSGDLNDDDATVGFGENTYRVVDASFTDSTAVLDGFTIEAGFADLTSPLFGQVGAGLFVQFGSPSIRHCVFQNNVASASGAGLLAHAAAPTLTACIFQNNVTLESGATGGGGILSRFGSDVMLANCLLRDNQADFGGGVDVWHANLTALNCTFKNNHAFVSGGAAEASYDPADLPNNSSLTLVNCILWDNTGASSGTQLAQTLGERSTITVSYTDSQGGSPAVDMSGGGTLTWDAASNLDVEPLFADAEGHLSAASLVIDAGDNEPVFEEVDLDGNRRFFDGGSGIATVDLGAYEFFPTCGAGGLPPGVVLMDWDADGDIDLVDFEAFFGCLTGPDLPIAAGCIVFDLDGDCDVDLPDFDAFQSVFSQIEQLPPTLCVSPRALSFGGATSALTFAVWNCGSGLLNYTITDDAAWLSVAPAGGSASGLHETITVNVDTTGLADGVYQGQVDVTPEAGTPVTVTVFLVVGSGGALPASFANRTTGVAPLPVLFDVVDPNSAVIQPTDGDYAALHYVWDFGDPSSGSWATDGRSRNQATDYIAGHVYQNPGTYVVTLNVTTPAGQTLSYNQTITVDDPVTASGWTTYYVAANGSNTNDGLSPAKPFKTFTKALSKAGTGTRILFRRGDTWTISTGAGVSAPGPGIIGAYANADGSDDPALPKPKIVHTGSNAVVVLSGPGGVWRIMDLELEGNATSSIAGGIALGNWTGPNNGMVLRCDISKFAVGIACGNPVVDHENFIVDCNLTNIGSLATSGYDIWFGGKNSAILGNVCGAVRFGGGHILRVWHARRTVISHNILLDPRDTKLALKIHNAEANNPPLAEYIIVSDNWMRGKDFGVSIAPQNRVSNEPVEHVVFERNLLTSNSISQLGLLVAARDVTVRNNIFDATGGWQGYKGVVVEHQGAEPTPRDVRIYNNTIYRGDVGDNFVGIVVHAGSENTVIRNNLVSAPLTMTVTLIDNVALDTVEDHNLLTLDAKFAQPAVGDFTLLLNSPAIDQGVDLVHVREDHAGIPRPQGSVTDIGAYEFVP